MEITKTLAEELKLKEEYVKAAVEMLDEGNTVPFIARYRKERTGAMDDTALRTLSDRLNYLRSLDKRRDEVTESITSQGKMTEEIEKKLSLAKTLAEIEDIYRPYRPKRKTRASEAREKGLEGLAKILFEQKSTVPLEKEAEKYINPEKNVKTVSDAIKGASDIVAEDISDDADIRKKLKKMFMADAKLKSVKANEDDISVYGMYADFSEEIRKIPSYRVLAINRGEKEKFLKVSLEMPEYLPLSYLENRLCEPKSLYYSTMKETVLDSYERLIFPSLEREFRTSLTDEAGEKALVVFRDNLKNLLLCPPIKGKTVLGYDPGYRTGCKLAVVDKTGKVLDKSVIFPTKPQEKIEESEKTVLALIKKWGIDVVAIGNGTASKESEIFIANLIKKNNLNVKYMMVSEAGASVYSASDVGAKEFPDYDVTLRSAISIARRLQDPLSELVKIEPKAMGVGQYQHDLKPARLEESLGGVVEDCVNSVGVDLNTASYMLLSYVSGINLAAAKSIVEYREAKGEFKSRKELKKVPKIGDRAFEQCAGFLRIPNGTEALDFTGVHPESYAAAKKLLEICGFSEKDLTSKGIAGLGKICEEKGKNQLAETLGIGEITLNDIISELEKPGRDLRDDFAPPVLRDDVMGIEDLKEGQIFKGVVRNVCDFGAFIDIGVHQDGLCHISKLADRFIRHPSEVVSVGDAVNVEVIGVDREKNKISLSMKNIPQGE